MAATGFTPIQLYYSSTTTNAPIAANLAYGELAINITDGKLFYKDNANAIQVIGWKTTPVTAGGTGQTSYTDGQLLIGNTTGNTLTKATLTAGTNVTITNGNGSITIAASGGGGSAATPTALGTVYGSTDNASISFIGYQAGNGNSTGVGNTALGYRAGYSNSTANTNTYIGKNAGYYSTGTANTFVGEGAGLGGAGTFSGSYNTVIGQGAGTSLTTGQGNCFVGGSYGNSGYFVTTGNYNTILGGYNGNQGGLDIRTSNSNIVLSDGNGGIGANWVTGGGWFQANNSSSWSTTSDARIKENIVDVPKGLEIIMALRPVEFDYILDKKHATGFIAQEYETVLPDQIIENVNITDELKALTNGEPVKAIQQNLVPYLVKAIQELKAEIDQLKGK